MHTYAARWNSFECNKWTNGDFINDIFYLVRIFGGMCELWYLFQGNIGLCVYAKHKIQSNFMPFECVCECVSVFDLLWFGFLFSFVLLVLTRLRW